MQRGNPHATLAQPGPGPRDGFYFRVVMLSRTIKAHQDASTRSNRQQLRLCRLGEANELPHRQLLQPGPGFGRGGAICSASATSPPSMAFSDAVRCPVQITNISTDSPRLATGLKPLAFLNIDPARSSRSRYASPSKTFMTRLPPGRSQVPVRSRSSLQSRIDR